MENQNHEKSQSVEEQDREESLDVSQVSEKKKVLKSGVSHFFKLAANNMRKRQKSKTTKIIKEF